MPCPGCGAKGHSRGETYGHILGCGATGFMEPDRFSPFEKKFQRDILTRAVDAALKSEDPETKRSPVPGRPEFVDAFARALARVLGEECVEPKPKAR